MDSKVFRLAIATIVSMVALIGLVVYAANSEKINSLFANKNSSSEASTESTAPSYGSSSVYGDQIGDNLKGFLLDEEFFDANERIPSVVITTAGGDVSGNDVSSEGDSVDEYFNPNMADEEGYPALPDKDGASPEVPAGDNSAIGSAGDNQGEMSEGARMGEDEAAGSSSTAASNTSGAVTTSGGSGSLQPGKLPVN